METDAPSAICLRRQKRVLSAVRSSTENLNVLLREEEHTKQKAVKEVRVKKGVRGNLRQRLRPNLKGNPRLNPRLQLRIQLGGVRVAKVKIRPRMSHPKRCTIRPLKS